MKTCPYQQYYNLQAGSGISTIYRGSQYQRGHGIGSFFGSLFRNILPLIRKGVGAVGREALKTGINFLGDLSENQPPKESFKKRIQEAGVNLKRKAEDKIEKLMNGSGYKKKRVVVKRIHSAISRGSVKNKKRSRQPDIFD